MHALPTFNSTEDYLELEFGWLQRQLNAYLHARTDPNALPQYLDVIAERDKARGVLKSARQQAMTDGILITFEQVARWYQLSMVEEQVLLCCLGFKLSQIVRQLMLVAQGDTSVSHLSVGFVAELAFPSRGLITDMAWAKPKARLIKNGLLALKDCKTHGVSTDLMGQAISVNSFLAEAMVGHAAVDNRLTEFCRLIQPKVQIYDVVLSQDTQSQVNTLIQSLRSPGHNQPPRIRQGWNLLLSGPQGCGKTLLVEVLASALNLLVFEVRCDRLTKLSEAAELIQMIAHNVDFLGAILHLVHFDTLLTLKPDLCGVAEGLFAKRSGLTILETGPQPEIHLTIERNIHFVIEMGYPDVSERHQLWESLLPQDFMVEADPSSLIHLASSYDFTGGQINKAIQWAQQRAWTRGDDVAINKEDLQIGAKSQLRTSIGRLAKTTKTHLTLEDIVFPDDVQGHILELLGASRVRKQVLNEWGFHKKLITGKGLVALLWGEPGTGKTLCCQILANELNMHLHIISVPDVMSKWVGETGKNMRDIFSQTNSQNTILLFDEADSLFSKRVKVERSQDQQMNINVNILLQELERFDGIVFMTTNMDQNMDEAFARRILYRIEIPTPGAFQREQIWKTLLPNATPTEGQLDFEKLGQACEISGGQIKNAILLTAFRCCMEKRAITQEDLLHSAHQQVRAAGKLVSPPKTKRSRRQISSH